MLPVEKINTDLPAGWFAFVVVLSLILLFGKQFTAWLLTKLYELFIGHKNHITDIGQ